MFTDEVVAEALSPKVLSLILFPTEKCNFRCTYCYEDFLIGKMSKEVVSGVKNLIARRVPEIKKLNISWFGGEPLVAKDIILDISTHAKRLCETHGVSLSGGFTTNAYLLSRELFESLVALSQNKFQITLDGDEEWHDKTRVKANGAGTFGKIWENLEACSSVNGNFDITLRLHVHGKNIESQRRLYSRLQSGLMKDSRFRVYFHKVSDLDPGRKIDEEVLDTKAYLEALNYITGGGAKSKAIGNKNKHPISEEHLSGYICYAAKPNSLMIRATGGIGKCTVALSDPRNDIGKLMEDGTIDIKNERLRLWMNGFETMSEKSLGCPLSTLPAMTRGEI